MTKIVIVGAGPCGLLAAHHLIRNPNNRVEIYEKRSKNDFSPGERSFPIALQSRGLEAIREIPGLESALADNSNSTFHGIWTVGLSLHGNKSERKISRPPTLSVERHHIVIAFLKELEKAASAENSSASVHFNAAVSDVAIDDKKLLVKKSGSEEHSISYDILLICDGARSKLRHVLADKGMIEFNQATTKDEYKSFYISRTSADGTVKLDGDS